MPVLIVFFAIIGFATAQNTALSASESFLSPKELFQRFHQAVVSVRKTDAFGKNYNGTGFFISPNLVATNHHVIEDAVLITLEDANKNFYTVEKVRAQDPIADTAILEVAESSPHVIGLAPQKLEIGERIYVIGNPHGYARSLSQGLVSGIRSPSGSEIYQITANVAQGSSGSPVLNEQGHAVGIVFGRLPKEAQIAFAAPASNLADLSDGEWQKHAEPVIQTPLASRSLPPEARPATPQKKTKKTKRVAEQAKSYAPLGIIRIDLAPWDSATVMAHLLKQSIEQLFPVGVEIIPGSNAEIFEGINASDRTYDLHPDVWLPNHRRFVSDKGNLTLNNYTPTQGLCVPRYVAETFSIRRRSDLNNPAIAARFDIDGDGKGEIWIGEEGWEATNIERLKARDYGYGSYFDLLSGEEKMFYARLDSLIASEIPVAFYCYGPHWKFRKHEIFVLDEPAYDPECFHLSDAKSEDEWRRQSRASCAAPPPSVHRYYSSHIQKKLPGVATFIEGFFVEYEELNKLINRMHNRDGDNAAVARQWMEANKNGLSKLFKE